MRNNFQATVDLAHIIREETGDRVIVSICSGEIRNDTSGEMEEYSFCELNGRLLTTAHDLEDWQFLKALSRQIVGLDKPV